jgi:putative tRNA adenosine deaminase-associated protein
LEEGSEERLDEGGVGMSEQSGEVDFALAAFREDGAWQVQEIASPAFDSVESLSHALRQVARDDAAVAMVAVDEDFFVLVRVTGASTRALLSDVTAADEWELAQSVIDFLGLPPPEDDDVEVPAGDLDLLGDLGLHAIDLGALLDDVELYPDEMLSEIARRLGFGELFDDAVGLTSA